MIKQIIILCIAAIFIAGLAFLWAWGSAKNEDTTCGMSCENCKNADACQSRKG